MKKQILFAGIFCLMAMGIMGLPYSTGYNDLHWIAQGHPNVDSTMQGAPLEEIIARVLHVARQINEQRLEDGDAPLHVAIKNKNYAFIDWLMNAGADLHLSNRDGYMPLHLAVALEDPVIVQKLLQAGASIFYRNDYGQTALDIARATNNSRIIYFLDKAVVKQEEIFFKRKAKIAKQLTSLNVHQYLFWAVTRKDVVELKEALNAGADINYRYDFGKTVLFMACSWGYNNIVQELLAHGADPNVSNAAGDTPLFVANNSEIIQLLLHHGADLHSKNRKGSTALHRTVQKGQSGGWCRPYPPKTNGPVYFEHNAQLSEEDRDYHALARELIQQGADVHVQDNEGDTPLHKACVCGDYQMVSILTEAGSNVMIANDAGCLPLHCACLSSSPEKERMVQVLLAVGSPVNWQKYYLRNTPLHCAVQCGSLPVVQRLLAAGADPALEDYRYNTPLHICNDERIKKVVQRAYEKKYGLLKRAAKAVRSSSPGRLLRFLL